MSAGHDLHLTCCRCGDRFDVTRDALLAGPAHYRYCAACREQTDDANGDRTDGDATDAAENPEMVA